MSVFEPLYPVMIDGVFYDFMTASDFCKESGASLMVVDEYINKGSDWIAHQTVQHHYQMKINWAFNPDFEEAKNFSSTVGEEKVAPLSPIANKQTT